MTPQRWLRIVFGTLFVFAACPSDPTGAGNGVTIEGHTFFPISKGTNHEYKRAVTGGTMECDSCHYPQSNTFADFTCISCHEHEKPLTDRLHLGVTKYTYTTTSCFSCHDKGETGPFDHVGITGECAMCHQEGAQFAALPVSGFTHPPITADCGGCHTTDTWRSASTAPASSFDPTQNVTVTALIPSYAGTAIIHLTEQVQSLPMVMKHASADLPATVMGDCAACHPDALLGNYVPGKLHSVLSAAPSGCVSCHASAAPKGFVGPASLTPRSPNSPEMKHDAVSWTTTDPTSTELVTEDCAVCHVAPIATTAATWATGTGGTTPATYHPSLAAKARPQPASCVDCHANSRSTAVLSSPSAALPQGVTYDHQAAAAMGDCVVCHSNGGATQWTSWTKGRLHLTGTSDPANCLPCHEGERPISITTWKDPNYTRSPFDYVGTTGFTHGDGKDCAACHPGPGTGGAWGGTQTWQGGSYDHAAKPAACLPCHVTQRPTAVVQDFNHTTSGMGECLGCHKATVQSARYIDLSDWSGAQPYPADSLIAAAGEFITLPSITLTRGANNLVTGMRSTSVTLQNAMLHTSASLPPELSAGLSPNYGVDQGKCWHCHTNTNGTVTDFTNGWLHTAFPDFRATPGGAVSAKPQPTLCLDCHDQMRPPTSWRRQASTLIPMDHSASFTAAVTIGGATVTRVDQLECSVCHTVPDTMPGVNWTDGRVPHEDRHRRAGGLRRLPLPAHGRRGEGRRDLDSGDPVRHEAPLDAHHHPGLPDVSHPGAGARATTAPRPSSRSGSPASLHDAVPTQPAACNDCHSVTKPAARDPEHRDVHLRQGRHRDERRAVDEPRRRDRGRQGLRGVPRRRRQASGSAWSKTHLLPRARRRRASRSCNVCHGGGSAGHQQQPAPGADRLGHPHQLERRGGRHARSD